MLQFQNLVPAIYSFDSSLALLGLQYGVDPSLPVFKAEGTVDDGGFRWTTAGQYLGSPLDWTASGTFDSGSNAVSWMGTGNYAGVLWAMEGMARWLSPTDFAIKDSISIGGTLVLYSGNFQNPDFNSGTLTNVNGAPLIQELATRHWYSFLFGTTTDGWVVSVDQDGKIATNVYTLVSDTSKTGVQVQGGTPGGSIEIGGTRYVKNGFVNNVPAPATWVLTIMGLGLLGFGRQSARRLPRRPRKQSGQIAPLARIVLDARQQTM